MLFSIRPTSTYLTSPWNPGPVLQKHMTSHSYASPLVSGQACHVMQLCNWDPANQNGPNVLIEDATVALTKDLPQWLIMLACLGVM